MTTPIRTLRKARALPIRLAAQTAGISVGAWHAIEAGTVSDPTLSTAVGMARVLGVSVDVLAELLLRLTENSY